MTAEFQKVTSGWREETHEAVWFFLDMRKVLLCISDGLNAESTYSCLNPDCTGVWQDCTPAPVAHNSAGCWWSLSCEELKTHGLAPSPFSG